MTIIAFISQKGGVGKSTFARALATEATRQGVSTLLADLDPGQQTSYKWSQRRKQEPQVQSLVFHNWTELQTQINKQRYNLVIIDGPAMISELTYQIAQTVDLIFQPVKPCLDDLEPAVIDFNTLVEKGIEKEKLIFIINQVINANSEQFAREYLTGTPYRTLHHSLPDKVSYVNAHTMGLAITEITHPTLLKKTEQFMEELVSYILSS